MGWKVAEEMFYFYTVLSLLRKSKIPVKLITLLPLYFRYFVTEVLETIAPPYSQEFVSLFLPLVENEEITGSMRVDMDSDPVSEFIVHCKATHGTNHIA